jgi:hypothetical protein
MPSHIINPLNAELNSIYHLLALLGAHHILHVSKIRFKHISIIPNKYTVFYSLHICTVFIVRVSFLHSTPSGRILWSLFKTLCCYVAISYVSMVVTS